MEQERKDEEYVKYVNQAICKMEASERYDVTGNLGYWKEQSSFGKNIIYTFFGTKDLDEYLQNIRETEIDGGRRTDDDLFMHDFRQIDATIGTLEGSYQDHFHEKEDGNSVGLRNTDEIKLGISLTDHNTVILSIYEERFEEEYDEELDSGSYDVAEGFILKKVEVPFEKFKTFVDAEPGIYPDIPETMLKSGRLYSDDGRYSEEELRELSRFKYVPGQFMDIMRGVKTENWEEHEEVTLNIPNGMVTELTTGMFEEYREELVEVSIPPSVKSIDKETFSNCPNLRTVFMCERSGIQDVYELFENCPKLNSVFIIPPDAEKYYDRQAGKYSTSSSYLDENGVSHKLTEIKRDTHDISEVKEAILNQKIAGINKVIIETKKEMEHIENEQDGSAQAENK